MTASEVLFDTWAWWEVLFATRQGTRLRKAYLDEPAVRIHTSAIAFGEVAAKMLATDNGDLLPGAMAAMRASATVHDVTSDLAEAGGVLRAELRRASPAASLADGIMLATARRAGATLVSADPAFRGQPDVVVE